MQITLNLVEPTASSIALDEVIFAQAITTIDFSVIPAQTLPNGTSCALMNVQGKILAHALIIENKADLNTNTVQCYEFVRDLPVNASHGAFLVLGSSTAPIAIVPVEVARNVLAENSPPTEYAPIYPTALELQETLARMQAYAESTATNAASVNNIAQTFPTTVENAKQEIENQTEAVTKDIMDAKKDAVDAASLAEGAKNETQGLVDSINYSFEITKKDVGAGEETFISPKEKDGVTPRLDNNNKDIHNVSGFSGERYNNARFIFNWDLARSNNTAYLASYMEWEGNRGLGGTNTFIQPLLPANKGTTAERIPTAIANFENAPLYWSGWFMFNDAQDPTQSAVKQVLLDWTKVPAGGTDTIALVSDLENISGGGGGSVYDVVSVTDNTIILDATKKFYSATVNGGTQTIAIDTSALDAGEKAIDFILRLNIGAEKPVVFFPNTVKFVGNLPNLDANSNTMIAFTSFDGGATWNARTVYNILHPTSKSYIQDGLIYHFDAIDNAVDADGNRYHNPSPTVWKNLVGTKDLTIGSSGVTFGENFATFVGTMLQNTAVDIGSTSTVGEGAKRIEVVFAVGADGFTDGILKNATLVSGASNATKRSVWISADGTDTLIGSGYYYEEPVIVYPISQGAVITASIPYNARITSANSFVNGLTQTVKNVIKSIQRTNGLLVGHNFYGKICAVRIYTDAATADEAFYHATLDAERFGA